MSFGFYEAASASVSWLDVMHVLSLRGLVGARTKIRGEMVGRVPFTLFVTTAQRTVGDASWGPRCLRHTLTDPIITNRWIGRRRC